MLPAVLFLFLYQTLLPQNYLWISPYIVGVDPHEVPQTMGHKHGPEADLHHFLNIPLDQPQFLQLLQVNSVSKEMHVYP